MNVEFINNMMHEPYIDHQGEYANNNFIVRWSFTYRNELSLINIEINCFLKENNFMHGQVNVALNTNILTHDKIVEFKYLEVPEAICNKGVGKELMLWAIKSVRAVKNYFEIKEEVQMKGFLSTSDSYNGNWNKSVPFYEKVGKLAHVKSYFTIGSNNETLKAIEFLKKAKEDGHIIYLI